MSLNTKLINTYSKALFQSLKSKGSNTTENNISQITQTQDKNISSSIVFIGEELLLIRSVLTSSNKIKTISIG